MRMHACAAFNRRANARNQRRPLGWLFEGDAMGAKKKANAPIGALAAGNALDGEVGLELRTSVVVRCFGKE